MANRGPNYSRAIEAQLQNSNRHAALGEFERATNLLLVAREACERLYPNDQRIGFMHDLRISRDSNALSVRELVRSLNPFETLADHHNKGLDDISIRLANIRDDLVMLALNSVGQRFSELAHLVAEAGIAEFWRGRIKVLAVVLGNDSRHENDASSVLNSAGNYLTMGSNPAQATLLSMHCARLSAFLENQSARREHLSSARRNLAAVAIAQPKQLATTIGAVATLAQDTTPEKIENSIRLGRI